MTTQWMLRGGDNIKPLDYFDDEDDGTVLDELRPPTPDDAAPLAAEVIDAINDMMWNDEDLACDDGHPELDVVESPELDALQAAIDAYVRAHVDLHKAAWIPTGRSIVRVDGEWREMPREET